MPTGRRTTKIAYEWTVQHKVIPKREGKRPKSPTGGRMTKVAYEWIVQHKVIPKREGQQLKLPTGGRSNVKSSLGGRDDDQSSLQVDGPT